MRNYSDKLIGTDAFSVEHKILNIILLLGICLAMVSSFFFSLFDLGSVPTIVSVTSVATLASLYYLSIIGRKYLLAASLMILIFGFVVVPWTWVSLGGIFGGTPFYALMFSAMITTLLRGFVRITVLVCFVIMLSALTLLQYTNPSLIVFPYTSDAQRYIDLYFNMLIAMTAIITFFVVILNHYIKEYQRSRICESKILKQKLDIELSRLDRLNLVGEMAASIGHEVRNPLTTVRGFLQLFQRKAALSDYAERFELMIGELDRANQIITDFLSLAKNKTLNLQVDNLNRIIHTMHPLIQADALLLGKNFTTELGDIPDLLLDENEIRQCLLNLVRNGFEATDSKGMVALRTYTYNGDVVLSIQDNGKGISPEIYANLGTPFITTKPQGTGLGLPVCYRIADRHHANIDVSTSPAGTTFLIRFPLL